MNIFSLSFSLSVLSSLISASLLLRSASHLAELSTFSRTREGPREKKPRTRQTYLPNKRKKQIRNNKREVSSIQESNCPPTLRSNNTHTPALPYLTVPTRTSLPFSAHCTPPVESIRTIQITQKAFSSNTGKRAPPPISSSPLEFPRRKGGTKMLPYPFTHSFLSPPCTALYDEYVRRYQNGQLLAPRFHIHCTARKKKRASHQTGPPHPVPARPFLSRPLVIPLH
ncbi:hypothetical protein J3E69DRAFT_327760 [Trichoderma sp. SZMC 28015]